MVVQSEDLTPNPNSNNGDINNQPESSSSSMPEPSFGTLRAELTKIATRYNRRVHDVIIQGNNKTKDYVIEAVILDYFKQASTPLEISQTASKARSKLIELGIFDSVNVKPISGPSELPCTFNVLVQVAEAVSPHTCDIGVFTKPQPQARSCSLEGGLKLKNLLGYADIWDGSISYGWNQTPEVSAGVSLPRIRFWPSPMSARASLLSKDWLKFSSYKEQALGFGVGLLSIRNHELVYNLTRRNLTDPSLKAGESVRRQLGHSLLSSLKYTFSNDKRNSTLRPTQGYAFSFTTLLAGLSLGIQSARFLRQECDFRYALPLGFDHAALNLGVSAGLIFPWGRGYLDRPSSLPDRFFMGGNTSLVCTLGGPNSVLGFKSRGLGPTEPRRQSKDQFDGDSNDVSERDALGGDFAVSAFADLSFDLPAKFLRDYGIHGHIFASTGNLVKLTENEWRKFSTRSFIQSFRSTVGCGIIIPINPFRLEVNYCHIVRQFEHDHGKTGVQLSFSLPM